ncbi:hypothetical protein BS47DRAFT_1442283 [Hydnum rufescens UP504]|uniref:Uncharacterized protein n=1 Tax=Hydnum rufescens UP504 TaxID=1448309 RepID=A0A9P6B2E1_9AGAM|nr:hypothetical protein BS47DRAFT_1442283 [Hydnum rufescens UP504]
MYIVRLFFPAVANADVESATILLVLPFTPAELFAPTAEILAEPIIGQMALTGTGSFDIILDMLKYIVDHCLPIQNILAAHTGYGVAMPGSMMPYNPSSPMYNEAFKGSAVAFLPLAWSGEDNPAGFASYLPGFSQSPFGAGSGSASSGASSCSSSSPGNHSSTSPYTPTSFRGPATSPFHTLPFATSPFFSRSHGARTLPTSPMLNLALLVNPHYTLTSLTFTPTSPQYSPQSCPSALHHNDTHLLAHPSVPPPLNIPLLVHLSALHLHNAHQHLLQKDLQYHPSTSHTHCKSLNRSFSTSVLSRSALPRNVLAHGQSRLTITAGCQSGDQERICRHWKILEIARFLIKPTTPSLQTEFNQGSSLVLDIGPSQDRPLGPSMAILKPSSSSHLQMCLSSSVIMACSQSMKEVNPQNSTSFITPKSKKSSIETFKIDAWSAQMLPTFPPDVHVRSNITVQDEQQESFSTRKNALFSSPKVHSTPKLNIQKSQMWKDEITLALEELGILTTEGDDGQLKMAYCSETPPWPTVNSSTQDSSASGAFSSGRRVPPSLNLPPIDTHFKALGSIQNLIAENTNSHAIMRNFIVPHPDGTPLTMAVPQPMTYSSPNVFHPPGYIQNQQQQQ